MKVNLILENVVVELDNMLQEDICHCFELRKSFNGEAIYYVIQEEYIYAELCLWNSQADGYFDDDKYRLVNFVWGYFMKFGEFIVAQNGSEVK